MSDVGRSMFDVQPPFSVFRLLPSVTFHLLICSTFNYLAKRPCRFARPSILWRKPTPCVVLSKSRFIGTSRRIWPSTTFNVLRRNHTLLHPMAQTCAILTKTKGFPDGKKEAKINVSPYAGRNRKFF
jgi:hypothetical protein